MVVAVDARRTTGKRDWDDPSDQPPGHLGISALMFDREDVDRFWAIVQGVGLFETAITRSRGHRVTAGFARTGRASTKRSVSACTSSCARLSTGSHVPANHVGCTGATMRARRRLRSRRGCHGVRIRRGNKSTRPRHVLRDPARPGHGQTMPEGHTAVWRTHDAGSSWQSSTRACRNATRTSASYARRWRSIRMTLLASTSGRARGRSSQARTKAIHGRRLRTTSRQSRRWRS